MEMDWMMEESQEHAYLTTLMEKLEMEIDTYKSMEVEQDDILNEELEHTILNEIPQEWEVEEMIGMED